MANCGSDARHLLPSSLFGTARPGKPPAPPLPVHVPCEGPGPRARRGLRDVPEGVPPRSGAEGDIWAGMEDEAERSLSPVALKLRGMGGSSATLVVTGAREQSQR